MTESESRARPESLKVKDALMSQSGEAIYSLSIQGEDWRKVSKKIHETGYEDVSADELTELISGLDDTFKDLGSSFEAGEIKKKDLFKRVYEFLYSSDEEMVNYLEKSFFSEEGLDEDLVTDYAKVALGVALLNEELNPQSKPSEREELAQAIYALSEKQQEPTERQDLVQAIYSLSQAFGEGGGDPKTSRPLRASILESLSKMFDIENLNTQGRLSEALPEIFTLILTENTDLSKLTFHFMQVCKALGEKVPFDLGSVVDSRIFQTMEEMAKAEKTVMSAEDLDRIVGNNYPDSVEAEALRAIGITVKVLTKDGLERKIHLSVPEAYNFRNGDFGQALVLGENLTLEMKNNLIETYPNLEKEIEELYTGRVKSDSTKNLEGRRIYVSEEKEYEDKETGAKIKEGSPIIFSRLSEEDKLKANTEDMSFKPWLDFDPTRLDKGGLPVDHPSAYNYSKSGRKLRKEFHDKWFEYIEKRLGVSRADVVAIDPLFPVVDYVERGKKSEMGLMPDSSPARKGEKSLLGVDLTEDNEEMFKQVFGGARLGKILDLGEAEAIFTREQFKDLPTDVTQQFQARLKPYLLGRYWDQYGVHNMLTRIMADSPFGSMTDRMLSSHAVLQAIEGKEDKSMYQFEGPGKEDLKLVALGEKDVDGKNFLPEKQKQILEHVVKTNKSYWLDGEESITVSWVVQNLQAGLMKPHEAEKILDIMNDNRMEKTKEQSFMSIRSNRQQQLAYLIGMSDRNAKILRGEGIDGFNPVDFSGFLEKSLGVDVSKLDSEEMMGRLGMFIVSEHEGIEMIEVGKKLWDVLKHRKKYEGYSENFGVHATQLGSALVQSLDERIEKEIQETVGLDAEEKMAEALTRIYASVSSGGQLQIDSSIRADFVKSVRELLSSVSQDEGWSSTKEARKVALELSKFAVAAASGMKAFVDWKRSEQGSKEGELTRHVGPGVEREKIDLSSSEKDVEIATLLRKKGIRAIKKEDGTVDVCGRNTETYYHVNTSKKKTSKNLRYERRGGVGKKVEKIDLANRDLLVPNDLMHAGFIGTFGHHSRIFAKKNSRESARVLALVVGSYLMDAGIITMPEFVELEDWVGQKFSNLDVYDQMSSIRGAFIG